MKTALITGIAGQDGSYLAEYLLSQGYDVHGLVRRNSVPEHQESRIDHISGDIQTHYFDLSDSGSISRLIDKVQPTEVYNLAAQSHVRISFDIPVFTGETNGIGVLSILEILRAQSPDVRFYQASSSEMFGDSVDDDGYQRESTPMHPVSPYGCAKLYAYHLTRNYRKSYKLFASNGILFNHESPRRGETFVTRKITRAVARIKAGLQNELFMGNLDAVRDWGYAPEYVEAMWLMLQQAVPQDYVISTGKTITLEDFVAAAFAHVSLDWRQYVVSDPTYIRPVDIAVSCADSSKIQTSLGWKPTISGIKVVENMFHSIKQ